ncbi:hypothetical protein Psta_1425 [Pirellula staleyi DSM 6068]|uniref:Translation elongation factor EFTu/EF1A C-terminal domain-containing protein n=1 Tax=Pirellula staleyi (strain ATCC 27377 / DSM 6068 / ICPB 4128) TaxID=530564 RepID=D2QWZ6_PIRSD|nr:hypothetical protein [Pirellula staleyi]ADB16100.1 hypothetical protein Psta_1425 [Pirellula staleyi DSM 6068]
MPDSGNVRAELTFLSTADGGRAMLPGPPWGGHGKNSYMPHLVVEGDPTYLGVCFVDGPQPIAGEAACFDLELMYPKIDYSKLIPGAAITVREGGKTVAAGKIVAVGE